MLQQTQVARVLPRYEAWLERWPTAGALAAAPLADVLRAWVGLGYNRRARRLWEACAVVAARGWPDDLRELPGVGPYTAAAVGAFAFGRDELPVDTNVARVLERLGERPPGGAGARPGAHGSRGDGLHGRAPRCGECPLQDCPSRGVVASAPAPRRGVPRVRFEDTDRYARGRVVAALANGDSAPAELDGERLARILAGLESDGLLVREGTWACLPGQEALGSART